MNKKIGFIGQGWIGKNYADDFEDRGLDVVRYSLEKPYVDNKEKIKDCDIVFIAVPTPSTADGFDASILKTAVKNVGEGKIAVIKSTLLPGTTEEIQKENPGVFIFHSPEFLSEATAAHDAANPKRNIIGYAKPSEEYRDKAKLVLSVLAKAPFELICRAKEAEFIKYGGNNWFYFKILFINLLYDLVLENDCDYNVIREGMAADPRVGMSHLMPVHKSGTVGSDNFKLRRKDDEGGGLIDVISFALRVVLHSLETPQSRNVLVLDEPLKWTGKLMSKAGQMIKEISNRLGLQVILVTHEPELSEIADRSFFVEQVDGISNVTVMDEEAVQQSGRLKRRKR